MEHTWLSDFHVCCCWRLDFFLFFQLQTQIKSYLIDVKGRSCNSRDYRRKEKCSITSVPSSAFQVQTPVLIEQQASSIVNKLAQRLGRGDEMLLVTSVLCLLVVQALSAPHHTTPPPLPTAERLSKLEQVTEQLGRQLMLQQLYVNERIRSDGDSGIKQSRLRQGGLKSYASDGFSGHSVAAMHDHSNLERTSGLGELIAVLNGVEFRTRHNDYKVKMPVNNRTYHGLQDIPFPPVPPSVLAQKTVDEQGAELREYFRAWHEENVTHRDYRPFFRPVLCVLEGAWTLDKDFAEPFSSDRHAIEASSWFELQEKIRYTSSTGDRLNSQNLAFLPTTIVNMTGGAPTLAQWNYRIFCHPLAAPVNKSHLVPLDDLGHRLATNKEFSKLIDTRMARFMVDEHGDGSKNRNFQWNELDDWMAEIPGKDNYGVTMTDDAWDQPKLVLDMSQHLNVANYHRVWKVAAHDAMGDTVAHRGFADRTLWVAENTQPRVAPAAIRHCFHHKCVNIVKRVSYAVPLELIFLTPLQSWNPFSIPYRGKYNAPEAAVVMAGGRNGGLDKASAYNGSHSKAFYFTPVDFFHGPEVAKDPADTTKAATGVLDQTGELRLLKSSGIRITMPPIPGVGALRTRYPLMPVHQEGSAIWKELEALRDVIMDLETNKKFLHHVPQGLKSYTASPSHHHN